MPALPIILIILVPIQTQLRVMLVLCLDIRTVHVWRMELNLDWMNLCFGSPYPCPYFKAHLGLIFVLNWLTVSSLESWLTIWDALQSVNLIQKLDLSMTKFFKVDPCRMLPKDEIGFGFVLMFFSIGLSLLAKGVCLPLLLGDFQHLLSKSNYHSNAVSWTFVWFCSMILPGLLLVSEFSIFLWIYRHDLGEKF